MNYSIYRISLDIHDTASQVSLSVKKGDTGRRIIAVLTENGKPYKIADGVSAVFRAKKPADSNGNRGIIYNDAQIIDNTICYTLVSGNTEVAGVADCEFTLYGQSGEELTSPRFALIIDETVNTDDEVEAIGKDELGALASLYAELDAVFKKADQMVAFTPPLSKDSETGIVQTGTNKGRENTAANSSAAFGQWNRVRKAYSIAAGWGNQIDAEKSAAFGAYNLLSGNANLANGISNEAKGYAGAVLGQDNISLADNSMCFGESLIATVPGQVVVGRNNEPNDDAIFIVGNGGLHRQNAFTVLKDGRMTMGGDFKAASNKIFVRRKWATYSINTDISLTHSGGSVTSTNGSYPLVVTSKTNAGGARPQMLVCGPVGYGTGTTPIRVEEGNSYTFSFNLKNPECRVRFWLCATESTVGFTSTAEKNTCVIFEASNTNECEISADWQTVTVEIPNCAYSGYLRFGICSTDIKLATFELDDIMLDQNVPEYNYVSKDGSYSATLYKIADLQTTTENIRQWLSLASTNFKYNISDTFKGTVQGSLAKLEEADASTLHDDQHNEILLHTFHESVGPEVAVVCVNRIVPDKMDVKERGIYVSKYIHQLTHNKWTDTVVSV